jgi:arabinan endo-1,5-alpha-L-arabinosidase
MQPGLKRAFRVAQNRFRHARPPVFWAGLLCGLGCLPFVVCAQEPVMGNYWAHDPSTMIKSGSRYYVFTTGSGIPNKYTTDLRNWTAGSLVFPAGPATWASNAVPGFDPGNWSWAPDVAFFNGKYHVYYSVSAWGTIDSVIGLVTSPSLTSPTWTDQGKVVQSDAVGYTQPETDTTGFNCIDPSILVDTNGTVWMSFGSYSSGILVTQLNPTTGKRLNTNSLTATLVANNAAGGGWGSTIEGSFIYQRGSYYYLFVNYGGCCSGIESTYNIRVGRSTAVTGPYLDKNGINMVNSGGTMLLESTGRYIGPGHPGILNDNGTNWFTYHYYDGNGNGVAKLGLNRIDWTPDGWPALTNDWSAFYPLDVDARDHRGAYSGKLLNGTTTTNDAARGRVLGLDGVTNWATLSFPVANASTFAAWVKWNGGGDGQRIFDFGSNTVRYLYLSPRASSGKMRFTIRNGGSEQLMDAPTALPTNSWCHVAVTLDGRRGIMFLNGTPVATNNSMTIRPWQVQARSNYIGGSRFTADPLFNGQIDSFRIFGRPLSATDIRDLAWAHPALAHRYSFNGNAADSVGMAHGRLFGNATITNNALKLTGMSGGYVGLPGGLVSWSSAATFEFWAAFDVSANWARVFDFGTTSGANGSQYVFFSPHTSPGSQRFEISTAAGIFSRDAAGTLDNRAVHVACILDPTNNYAAIYTNGVLELSVTTNLPPLTGVHTNLGYLGRSLFSSDGWLNATIDEFRIYDGRLTPQEIAANFKAGPDALALPLTLTGVPVAAGLTLQWPSYGAGFVLQGAEQLGAAAWSTTTIAPAVADGVYQLTVPKTNGAQFFRLRR